MNRLPILVLWAAAIFASGSYRVETIPLPPEWRGGASGVAFTPEGRAVVTSRYGEVWKFDPEIRSWNRFAAGLNEPMGVWVESERVVYVAQRPELTRIEDLNGDGTADFYRTINDSWGSSENYHEFFYGLHRDSRGNFYGALALESAGDIKTVRGPHVPEPIFEAAHRSETAYRGWAIKITPEGAFVPIAPGFRQPNGVGLSPNDELFLTDNQGDWKPFCELMHIRPGKFYGHPASLRWSRDLPPEGLSEEWLMRRRTPGAVVFPFGLMGVSSGEPVWDTTGGRFGPFEGQVFVADFSPVLIRVDLEKVAGEYQGACFPFIRGDGSPQSLAAGTIRMAFSPTGELYLAQTGGWGGGEDGLQRVSWSGRTPAEIHSMRLTETGFVLRFTEAMDRREASDPANYLMTRFRYYYQARYGSPRIDREEVVVREATPDSTGFLVELVVEDLQPGFIYGLEAGALRSARGDPLRNATGYYTLNRLLSGETGEEGVARLPRPGEEPQSARVEDRAARHDPPNPIAGREVYQLFCLACHRDDGRGIEGGAPDFRGDPARLAQPEEALVRLVTEGRIEKGMPAFGSSLSLKEIRDVLGYVRESFGPEDEN